KTLQDMPGEVFPRGLDTLRNIIGHMNRDVHTALSPIKVPRSVYHSRQPHARPCRRNLLLHACKARSTALQAGLCLAPEAGRRGVPCAASQTAYAGPVQSKGICLLDLLAQFQ